nr:hypothetical transcript [Hymenolepis microstoma]
MPEHFILQTYLSTSSSLMANIKELPFTKRQKYLQPLPNQHLVELHVLLLGEHLEEGTLFTVTSREAKEKDLQHCVPTELQPCRWYMLTLVFVYNRWAKSKLSFHVGGKIISSVYMAWGISTSDCFDRCMIGGAFDQSKDNLFSGRIASKLQLKFESEVRGILSETEREALIESKLSASIMFSYHPSARDHNHCLDQSPKPNSVFTHAPHALTLDRH